MSNESVRNGFPPRTTSGKPTLTTGSVKLEVTSSPTGATVAINPQRNYRHAFPGTGRILGSTPLSADLDASDFVYNNDKSCVSFVLLLYKRGYSSVEQHSDTCRPNGATGAVKPKPTYSFSVQLSPCPGDPNCGFPTDGP